MHPYGTPTTTDLLNANPFIVSINSTSRDSCSKKFEVCMMQGQKPFRGGCIANRPTIPFPTPNKGRLPTSSWLLPMICIVVLVVVVSAVLFHTALETSRCTGAGCTVVKSALPLVAAALSLCLEAGWFNEEAPYIGAGTRTYGRLISARVWDSRRLIPLLATEASSITCGFERVSPFHALNSRGHTHLNPSDSQVVLFFWSESESFNS